MKIEEFNNVSYVIGETSKENWEILDLYKSNKVKSNKPYKKIEKSNSLLCSIKMIYQGV